MANHPSGKSYSAATIRTYASAIKSVVLESGIMPASMPGRLSSQVRAGVQALHHGASRTRLPLTIGVLEEIYPCFDQSKRIDRVTFAIISTGVHGLFRLGELCPTTLEQKFFPRRADYSVVEEDGVALVPIFLHRSKTDKLHQGISVSVPHNSRTTSAHRALVELFLEPAPNRVLTLTSDPLFPDSSNPPHRTPTSSSACVPQSHESAATPPTTRATRCARVAPRAFSTQASICATLHA